MERDVRMSQVGAVPEAQKSLSFKNMLNTFFNEKLTKSFETPKRCLSWSENASRVPI